MYHAPDRLTSFAELRLHNLSRLFWTLSIVLCACRGGEEELPPSESTASTAEALELMAVESSSTPAATAAPSVVAVTPSQLASELDPTAANILLDVAALRLWADGLPAASESGDRVAELVAEAIASQAKRVLRLGGRPEVEVDALATIVAFSVRADGLVVVSDAPLAAPDGRLSRTSNGDFRLAFGAELTGGAVVPDRLPSDAFFTFWAPSPSVVPAPVTSSLDFLVPAGVWGLALGIRGDGSLVARLESDRPDAVSLALGRGQAFASQMVGQLNLSAPPEMQPWVTYANRVVQSLFSVVVLDVDDSGTTLTVAAPMCGGVFGNLLSMAVLITLADAASEDARTAPREFVAMSGHLADGCDAQIAGPAPILPAGLLSVGTPDASARSVVAIVDLAAALRRGLPRGFGLLPFAMDTTMLSSVFSGRPMGLDGLDDPSGHIVLSSERTAGSGAPAHRAILFPPGMRTFLPPESGIDTMRPVPMAPHVAFASPAVSLRERLSGEPAAHWMTGHAAVPSGAYAAAFLGGGMVQPWADRLDRSDPARSWVSAAAGGLLWLDDDGAGALLYGVPEPPSADEVRASLPGLLGQITLGRDSESRTDEREEAVRRALEQISIRTTSSTVEIRVSGSTMGVVAAALRIGIPMVGGQSGRTVGLPQAFQIPR